MLIDNPIYFILKNKLYQPHTALSHSSIIPKEVGSGKNAIFQTLTIDEPCSIEGYALSEHHLSYYELQDRKDMYFSQYHYTAYFTDVENQAYRLHVYFDENDQYLGLRFDRKEMEGHEYAECVGIKRELKALLVQLAISNSFKAISDLRQQQQQLVKGFEAQYRVLEKSLRELSKDLPNNHKTYQKKLRELIGVLELLCPLRPDYHSLLFLFRKSEKACQHLHFPEQKLEVNKVSSSPPVIEEKKSAQGRGIDVSVSSSPPEVTEGLQKATQALENYKKIFALASKEQFPAEACEDLVNHFLAGENCKNEMLVLMDSEDQALSTSHLQKWHDLVLSYKKEANNLVFRLLTRHSFTQASRLRAYVQEVGNMMLVLALKNGDAALLKFLFEMEVPFSVNTFLIEGHPALLHCFLTHHEKTPKMECFSLLLQNGASPLTPAPDGLPLAHHILVDRSHPLRQAFINNADKIFANPDFYCQLYKALEVWIKKNPSDPRCDCLSQQIEEYKNDVNVAQHFNKDAINTLRLSQAEQSMNNLQQQLSPEKRQSILNDPEIQAKRKILEILQQEYLSRLSSVEKRKLLKQGTLFLKNVEELFNIDGLLDLFDLKTSILQTMNDFIQISELGCQLLDLQAHAKKKPFSNRRARSQFQSQEQTLIDAINQVQAKYLMLQGDVHLHRQQLEVISTTLGTLFNELGPHLDELKELGLDPKSDEKCVIA